MDQTDEPVKNFIQLYALVLLLERAHDALKQIREKVQTATDCAEKTKEIESSVKWLEKRSLTILNGGLSREAYDHPKSCDVARKVMAWMNELEAMIDEDEVRKLAEREEVVYHASLVAAGGSIKDLERLHAEGVKAVIVPKDSADPNESTWWQRWLKGFHASLRE
ncbi:unnamed protein product [Clonostachys rosea]|uniref:Uncharacterized protein n=1 Tax=Bionectria ochroleuca TaxID=29856 RepID=A0ABY6UKU7_BIOOC|nr:unnamed protein product [Clonostachys rosea]